MGKPSSSTRSSLRLGRRGASLIEYALLIVGVLLVASGAYRMLGSTLSKSTNKGSDQLTQGNESGGNGGGGNGGGGNGGGGGGGSAGGGGGSGGGGGGGGGGGSRNMSAASKVNAAGMGGGQGAVGGGGGGGSSEVTDGSYASVRTEAPQEDYNETRIKRIFGLLFLVIGVGAISYVVGKARNVKKEIDAQGNSGPDS